ncbi:hypothetical protein K491DRAFT_681902 [Lophiostoma macrostomum CBS 122681]|uniref:Ribonuclease P/MRP protein subunit POP5 n=1 Tax=Lophiostoma macrostomum CBS 122681 TaxID=1314788 RepID=A0A6A6SVY8_9PLEO|nr:hypothetical protein K491DRAFT_681902 [Lophiostoma macrostomum CBS 122681]
MVRVKSRYLVVNYLYPTTASSTKDSLPGALQFHQPTPDDFHVGRLSRAIQDGVAELFGDYGMGMAATSLKINYHSTATSTSIIRCPQAHYEMIWAALTFMTKLPLPKPNDVPVVVKVVRVSGTIKKAEEEVIRRAKEIILRARLADGNADKAMMKDVLRSVEMSKTMDVDDAVEEEEDEEDESESD